jgi:hypothetical protein
MLASDFFDNRFRRYRAGVDSELQHDWLSDASRERNTIYFR